LLNTMAIISRLLFSAGFPARSVLLASTRYAHFLDGVKMLNKEGKTVSVEQVKDKVMALYFSAGWCPSCRMFTPKIKNFYNETKSDGFELLWVSRDKTEEDLKEYYEKALSDCLYLPHGSPYIREFLHNYNVKTIPQVRVVDSEGRVLVEDAREKIQTEGAEDAHKLFKQWQELNKKKAKS